MKRRSTSKNGIYCVDSNVLIEIHRDYPIGSFPTLWTELTTLVADGRLISSSEVLRELGKRVGDPVHGWADPFVVATAKASGAVVVTHEADDGSSKRPKIPLVCRWSRVACIRFPEIVTREQWIFR